MIYNIELVDVGRDDHCEKFVVETDDLDELATAILNRASNHLMSSNCWLTEAEDSTDEKGVFSINAGFHTVGKAIVRKEGN